jgi:ribosomal protein L11 methyltransferase
VRYPALDVAGADPDLLLAVVDDCSPTALEERPGSVTLFFADAAPRDRARAQIARELPMADTAPREVDDEDWARRSQQDLVPVTVGDVTVAPPWASIAPSPGRAKVLVVVQPSMGFGTGHHATTRLCLGALQTLDLAGASVLDVGTGSGVLAIAARRLGARCAIGLDNDPDAIQAAARNLLLNPGAEVTLFLADFSTWFGSSGLAAPGGGESVDVLMANLTGALLTRMAPLLRGAVRPSGSIVVSGLLEEERDEVVAAFSGAELVWESSEDEWVGLRFRV